MNEKSLEEQEQMLRAIVKPRQRLAERAEAILQTEDFYTLILRGHSLIQASLFDALMVKSMNRPMFDKARLSFMSTVYLAIAFNLIPEELEPFLKSFDSLRGELAHGFDDVTEAQVQMLYGKLPDQVKKAYDDYQVPLYIKFRISVVQLVATIQQLERASEYNRMVQYLRQTSENTKD